ncbi:MAG: MnhB domain-containing protein [Candidatus Brocadiia bacterium]
MDGTSIVVKTVTRWVVGFIFLYGLYIMAFGHLTPGGGFAGGVILACAFVLEVLAWGKERAFRALPFGVAKKLDSVGALGFLLLAVLGLLLARNPYNFVFRVHIRISYRNHMHGQSKVNTITYCY